MYGLQLWVWKRAIVLNHCTGRQEERTGSVEISFAITERLMVCTNSALLMNFGEYENVFY